MDSFISASILSKGEMAYGDLDVVLVFVGLVEGVHNLFEEKTTGCSSSLVDGVFLLRDCSGLGTGIGVGGGAGTS